MRLSLLSAALAAIVVLGTYETALRVSAPQVDSGQDQFATNSIRLEDYVDEARSDAGVVVGSSLTASVPSDAWPKDWRVLSQSGSSAVVGLDVIAASRPFPKKVLIEINSFDAQTKPEYVANAVDWPKPILRKLFWFSRTAYQPANLLVWSQRPLIASPLERPAAGFALLLGVQRESFARPPNAWMGENIRRTKEIVDLLRREAVEVAFFEMPVDRTIMQMSRAQAVRRAALRAFPRSSNCWLSVDDGGTWHTVDGAHLLAQDARRAARILAAQPCIRPAAPPAQKN